MTQATVVPTPDATRPLLNVTEALTYQRDNSGHVAFGRDALYAIARRRLVPVVVVGTRKVLFPPSSIDLLLSGTVAL